VNIIAARGTAYNEEPNMQANTVTLKQQAMTCLQGNRYPEARKHAAEACRADRNDVEAWTLLAAAHAGLGAMDDVAEACRAIVRLQPGNVTGHYNLGVAYHAMKKSDKAEKCYRKVLELQPGNTAATLNLAAVLVDLGRPQESIRLYEMLLAADPAQPVALNGIGLALRSMGEYDKAIEHLEKSLRIAPQLPETHYNLGLTLASAARHPQAGASFQRAIDLKPDYVEAHYELGMARIREQRYPEAETHLSKAAALRPAFLAAHFQLGHVYYLQEKFSQAVGSYREVLARDPANVPALNNLGRIYERTGQYDEAIKQYRAALKRHPKDSTIFCNLGRTCMAQQNWSAAARHYRDAIAAAPDDYEGHLGLGQAYCEMGDLESAKACFLKTIELKHDLPIAKHLLANIDTSAAPDESITDYIASLFDDYADRFDQDLVDKLKYGIPELLSVAIREHLPAADIRLDIMDLGCGTGLCGPLLKDIATRLDGVDLSARMIDKARARGVYDDLRVGDITRVMQDCDRQYDLIIAADVFVYIGDLSPVFRACVRGMRRGGLFAFSIELLTGGGYRLLSSGRHAHSHEYILGLCAEFGLELLHHSECVVRLERNLPVQGMNYVLRLT
jgi:predicted TPR repeat methyltransferase